MFFNKREEFSSIFIEHVDSIYGFALRLTGNPVDAEDLVSDTFLRAFRFFFKFKKGTNVKSWLFKIAHNLFINDYRKKKKKPEMMELKEEILIKHDTAPDFFSKFLDTDIQEALDSLPEEFKEVIALSDIEGFNYKEISKILGCPLGTVRSRLFRGRRLLFEKLYNYAKSLNYI